VGVFKFGGAPNFSEIKGEAFGFGQKDSYHRNKFHGKILKASKMVLSKGG
jgi:hypothetical protein